jgi:3-hydroxymyristoyl/3-hydroxydecanoyl-(acyl carrier protein) dehydratase
MTLPERISGALENHPWLTSAYASDAGIVLLLNAWGHAEVHCQGRQSLLDSLQAHLTAQGLPAPRAWRLLDAMPDVMDDAAIVELLKASRPKMATPVAERHLDGIWTLSLRLPLDLVHFDDHFRKAPVLPGVVQVSWALALAAPRLGTSTHCRDMEALKFQRLLRPGDQLELSLRYEDEAGAERGKLHFAYHIDGAHCSSGRLRVVRTHD